MKRIVFVLILFSSTCFAQKDLYLSFRGETALMYFKVDKTNSAKITIPFIQNFYIPFSLVLSNDYILEFRPGYMLGSENYEGFELGSFLYYCIKNSDFSINSGINFHFNHDTEGNEGFYGETLSLVGFGINYKTSNKVSLELSYQIPIDSNYGFYGNSNLNRRIKHSILGLLKFGLLIKTL